MTNGQKLFRQISRKIDADDFSSAFDLIKKYEREIPEEGMKAKLLEARVHCEIGNCDTAIKVLKLAVAKWPECLSCRYSLSCYLEYERRWLEAKAEIDELVQQSIKGKDEFFLTDARVRSAWYSMELGDMHIAKEQLGKLLPTDSFLSDQGPVTVIELLDQINNFES